MLSALTGPRPPFQHLIVRAQDRLGRDTLATAGLMDRFRRAGVTIHEYVGGPIKLETATDRVTATMKNYAGDAYAESVGRNVAGALQERGERGWVTGGSVFGYRNVRVEGHVERQVVPDEARVIKTIFEMFAAGDGPRLIAHRLNAQHVPTPVPRRKTGRRGWSRTTVKYALQRPLYNGRPQYGQRKTHALTELVEAKVPALRIVDDLLWQTCQRRLARAKREHRGQGNPLGTTESRHLLVGFGECGVCHGGFMAKARPGRTPVYKCVVNHLRGNAICSNSLTIPMMEANIEVIGAVEEVLHRFQVGSRAVEAILEDLAKPRRDDDRGGQGQELAQVELKITRLSEALSEGVPVDKGVLRELEARRRALKAQIAKTPVTPPPPRKADVQKVKALLERAFADWDTLLHKNTPLARGVLRTLLVGRIVFTPKKSRGAQGYVFKGPVSLGQALEGVVGWKAASSLGLSHR
jgi:DNA invertase Pin-like site-specific DNA recombinase